MRLPQIAAECLHRLISPGYVALQRTQTTRSISAVASGRRARTGTIAPYTISWSTPRAGPT